MMEVERSATPSGPRFGSLKDSIWPLPSLTSMTLQSCSNSAPTPWLSHVPHDAVRVEPFERDGLEESGHAGRGGDGVAEPHLPVRLGGLVVVHAPEAVVAVDGAVNARGRLAHVGGREVPRVARVERGRVQDEYRRLGVAPPVVVLRAEVVGLALRADVEFLYEARLVPAAVPDAAEYLRLEQLARAHRARVALREDHPEVRQGLGDDAHAYVALHAREEVSRDARDGVYVVLPRYLGVGLLV